jgi:hypothetical protein
MSDTGQTLDPGALLVVRVGAVDRFAALRAAFTPDGVEVVWDRRFAERRRPDADSVRAERRRRDRRGVVPSSWSLLDFIVVPSRRWAS